MPPLARAAAAHPHTPTFAAGFCALLVAGALLGLVAVLAWGALRSARCDPRPRVLTGLRLSLASMVGCAVGACLNGLVALSGHACIQGPPGSYDPLACPLAGIAGLISLGAAVVLLASFVVWPPWRGPRHLQLFRLLHALAWWAAANSWTLAGWD